MRFLLLRVHPEVGGQWSAWVGPLFGQAERVELGAADASEILARSRGLRRPSAVCVPGHAARQERQEEELGRRLGALLDGGQVAGTIGHLRGLAQAEGVPLCVLVDAPLLPQVPWELLAWSRRGLPVQGDGGCVARLGGGVTVAGPVVARGHLRALVWCPTPEDAACRGALEALQAACGGLGVPLTPLYKAPPQDPDTAELLFIVCHGRIVDGGGELLFGQGARYAGSVCDGLTHALSRACLVVVDTCSGASPQADDLSRFAERLLRAGAQACVASSGVLDAEASRRFSGALLRAIAAGRAVPDAVTLGRRAVAELAHPHPSARPHNLQLIVSSAEALRGDAPVARGWTPPGWPPVAADLRALLGRAHGLAQGWGLAHVGVEHVVGATEARGLHPGVRSAHAQLMRAGESFWAGLRSLLWVNPEAPLQATPRLVSLGGRLPAGAGVRELWAALAADPHHGLHVLGEGNFGELLAKVSDETDTLKLEARSGGEVRPATSFEVVWGPRCGARVTPKPGQRLGRWAQKGAPEVTLAGDNHSMDRKLSRRHLQYLRPGHVRLLQPARLIRRGETLKNVSDKLSSEVEVFVGDMLLLSDATWLRAVG